MYLIFLTSKLTLFHDYSVGRVHFDALVSNCKGGPCILENVRAKTVNSEDIANTYQQAVQQTDKSIPSLKTRRIEVLQGLPINTTSLSGHDTKDYLTIDDDLKFQNRIKIKGNLLVNGHVNVKGQVDGHSISPNTLLLRQGNQHFNCKSIDYLLPQEQQIQEIFLLITVQGL